MIAPEVYPRPDLSTDLLTAALARASRGIPVFPCVPGGKEPLTRRGHLDASTDPRKIKAWWTRHPNANIGIPTGERSGLLVLDVDVDEDKDGFEGLASLTSSLPDTYAVRTGGGGAHFYYRYPPGSNIRDSASKIAPGVDIRGEGGYVIAAPSRTTGPYAVVDEQPLTAPPEWLLQALRSHPHASVSSSPTRLPVSGGGASPVSFSEIIPEGRRNHGLTRIAGSLRARGHDDAHLFSALERINEDQCVPPLPAPEVHKIARSVCRYPVGVPAAGGPSPEVLEALEGVEAGLWARPWRGMGGKSERDVMVALISLSRRHGEIIPAGVRVEVSYRALALLAAVSLSTVFRAVKRMKKAGLLRADNLGRLPEEAGAFVLVAGTPATTGYTPTTAAAPGVEGVSTKRAPRGAGSRSTFTAPRLRWSAPGIRRMGKSAGQVVDTLEAAGGTLTLEELAERTGSKRPRDLKRLTLPRLVEAGVVAVEAGVVSLAGDWREAVEVERERAGENAAHRRDAARYEREREAYRRRDETAPEAVPSPLRALAELERIGPHPVETEHVTTDRGLEGTGVVSSVLASHNTVAGRGDGPAPGETDRTGQERSVDSGHEPKQAEESGETGDSGAGESGAQERGTLREWEPWVPSPAYLRMVDQGPRRAA
jgi:hypothetical protein